MVWRYGSFSGPKWIAKDSFKNLFVVLHEGSATMNAASCQTFSYYLIIEQLVGVPVCKLYEQQAAMKPRDVKERTKLLFQYNDVLEPDSSKNSYSSLKGLSAMNRYVAGLSTYKAVNQAQNELRGDNETNRLFLFHT